YGRVSRHGVTPLAWTLDHAGPMARNVRDVARMLKVLAGPDEKDASSAAEPVDEYEAALGGGASLAGRRFVVAREVPEFVDPAVGAVYEAALRHLESLGAKRVEGTLPHAPAMNIACDVLINAEAAVFHEENLRHEERRRLLDPAVRLYATTGRFYMATDYVKAQRLRLQLQADLEAALGPGDVLVCPCDPTLTPKVGEAPLRDGRELMWFE